MILYPQPNSVVSPMVRFRLIRLIALCGGLAFGPTPSQDPRQLPVVVQFAAGEPFGVAPEGSEVPLLHRVAGARPTHFRVSRRTDFGGASWRPYHERPTWQATRAGVEAPCRDRAEGSLVRLHFQVRTVLGEQVRVVDGRRVLTPLTLESNVLSAAVCVIPRSGS